MRPVGSEGKSLFVNRLGFPLSARYLEKIVDKAVKAAGIAKDKISPHKLRHTFATLLYGADVDLIEIQALMGHASIASTAIYVHTDDRRKRAAVDKLDVAFRGAAARHATESDVEGWL